MRIYKRRAVNIFLVKKGANKMKIITITALAILAAYIFLPTFLTIIGGLVLTIMLPFLFIELITAGTQRRH